VLFEAATGRLPFQADSPYHLMRQHLEAPPPDPLVLAPALPARAARAILRLLAKDPLDRFPGAAAVARAFDDDAPQAEEEPPLAVPQPRAGTRACARCGGWFIEVAGVCGDCGARTLQLERERPGVSVLVTGPGNVGDKLEGRLQVALFRIVQALPPGWAPREGEARQGARIPFFVARNLTRASAASLVQWIELAGVRAEIHEGRRGPDSIRQKASQMTRRVAGGWTVIWSIIATTDLLGTVAGRHAGRLLSFGTLLVGFQVASIFTSRRARRPMLSGPPDAGGPRPMARLGVALGALQSRQDRRLLGRIAERQDDLVARGLPEAATVADRVADLAEALVTVEQADVALAAAPLGDAAAQSELRRLERGRTLVRAELLHLASRLEALGRGLSVGPAATGELERQAAEAIDDLAITAEAHGELEAFLARRPVPS
jgi:hypothetical protein